MTVFEWAMLAVASVGALMTAGTIVGGAVWAVARIKQETTDRINVERTISDSRIGAERKLTNDALTRQAADMAADQKVQDDQVGETVRALRSYIEAVEKEMHAIEMWGRDHYVQKPELDKTAERLDKATERLELALKEFAADIKTDIRALTAKIDGRSLERTQ